MDKLPTKLSSISTFLALNVKSVFFGFLGIALLATPVLSIAQKSTPVDQYGHNCVTNEASHQESMGGGTTNYVLEFVNHCDAAFVVEGETKEGKTFTTGISASGKADLNCTSNNGALSCSGWRGWRVVN